VNYDLYTEYSCKTEIDVRKIVGNIKDPYTELESIYSRILLLVPSVIERVKEFAKSGHYKYGGGYKSLVFDEKGLNLYTRQLIRPSLKELENLGIYPPSIEVEKLPCFSVFLQIHFTLATPCYIGDNETYYLHECSQLKEKVFKVPMLSPSSWKGLFRSVALQLAVEEDNSKIVDRLFGSSVEDVIETGERGQGRLRFYPTFFDTIGLDVINPHSRRTKSGTVPILEEIVVPNSRGIFTLVYIPIDLLITEKGRAQIKTEISEDLRFLYKLLKEVLHTYGFSAKSSRGFGIARSKYVRNNKHKDLPGGFIEMSGVPVFKEENQDKIKENTFYYINQVKRIIEKIAHKLSELSG